MKHILKRMITILLALCLAAGLTVSGFASVSYMPDVTPEMSSADFWADLDGDADRVLMTREEIDALNAATAQAAGTMIVDMHDVPADFDGVERSEAVKASAKADAEYYFGWIYAPDGKLADWNYFQKMIDNCADPSACRNQSVRLGMTYECFGLSVARNSTWQCNMPVPKIDMVNMSVEEKCLMLDRLPLGTALTFSGHEMMYLGKSGEKYYVVSTVSSLMDPYDASKRLRARDVMINTLDVRRANGMTWLQALDQATLIGCGSSTDVPQTMWYHDGVAYCLKNDILSAKKDGYFGLDDAVTRAEAADTLWRMAGQSDAEEELSFTDVADGDAAAIRWAADTGVMVGYGGGLFGPDDPATREQLTVILHRFAAAQGLDVNTAEDGALQNFPDSGSISTYALDAMQWACACGILHGDGHRLLPQDGLTRAQFAVVLQQYGGVAAAKEAAAIETEGTAEE